MASNIIVGRTRARSQAIQVLFQAEIQGIDVFDLLAGGEYVLDDGPIDEFAEHLARGVAVNRIAIDRLVAGLSHNWNLSRMPLVDRCVMGIAIFEIFCDDDTPTSVAISEAVELSKVYGTDDSSAFVNGILGRVATLTEENPGAPLNVVSRLVADAAAAGEEGEAAEGADEAEGTVVEPAEGLEDTAFEADAETDEAAADLEDAPEAACAEPEHADDCE